MPKSWSSIFDRFGLKTVSRTDLNKSAYLPNEEQRLALKAAGFLPGDAEDENLIPLEVLGEKQRTLSTSYYASKRQEPGREPEVRMGRGLISWLDNNDTLLIGNIGDRIYALKANRVSPEEVELPNRKLSQAFKPRARLLQLLGDQLIGSSKLAVFELVKNAYDADADEVDITMGDLGTAAPWIRVEDNGQGMSLETIRDVWLVPGDDHREKDRSQDRRSPRYHRLPLGEKGVGRFAVHKLGGRVRMTTRAAGCRECHVSIDWSELMSNRFLEDAAVTVTERDAKVFTGDKTGTRIRIDDLSQREWTRAEVRDLYRQVTSISSPFSDKENDFEVEFNVPGFQHWISELPDASDLLQRAPWRFRFEFDGEALTYTYAFRGVPGISVDARTVTLTEKLQIAAEREPDDLDASINVAKARRSVNLVADEATIHGIGTVKGTLYVYDRDREILSRYSQSRLIERFLDQNGGIRVYRDDIRIYNYGEPGDDWLGLDLRRVNSPTKSLSRNIVIGLVDLDLEDSTGLKEKTNREGFVENAPYRRLRQVVLGAISVFETERRLDKRRIRLLTGNAPSVDREVTGPIGNVRKVARSKGFLAEIDPSLRRVEQEFRQLREDFLRAGISQVGLAVVFHEVERGIGALASAIAGDADMTELKRQVGQLQGVLETSTQLLRKGDKKTYSLRQIVRRARDLTSVRFRVHNVRLVCPALEEDGEDAESVFAFGLALGAITNIIDNAIHWLKVGIPSGSSGQRRIFMDVVPGSDGRPMIVIADNGPGFRDPPEQVVEPFFSRRPDGMGLGLYYANLAMNLNDGELLFPSMDDFDIPDEFDGAVVALVFKEGK